MSATRSMPPNAAWTFGGATPGAFDEHVARSVPLYDEGHELVVNLSDFFLSEGSTCYELGCSTGALIMKIALHHRDVTLRAFGIDVEQDMIAFARAHPEQARVTFLQGDIPDITLEPCDLIVAYYTLQFVRPRHRQQVFDRIYEALNWGGALLLFEMVRAADARFQDVMSALYVDYKLRAGYRSDEIVAKSRSLKGVLEPFSTQANVDMMRRAGFEDVMSVMKYVCFEGFLAIK